MYDKPEEVMSDLLAHIEKAKDGDRDLSMSDIILDFIHVNDIEMQYVAEAIASDSYFKKVLKNDCIARKIIKTEAKPLDNW